MNMQKTAREIGLLETAVNLSKFCNSEDVMQKVGASMPLPDENIRDRIPRITAWLHSFDKRKYMFLTPEIALIDEMARDSRPSEVIVTIPCDLEQEAKDRMTNNLPRGIEITVLEEPFFPQSFFPGNGMMVVCGYLAGGRPMVLSDTFRMIEHYNGFLGRKVFIPYKELDVAARFDGWIEVNKQRFHAIWRDAS